MDDTVNRILKELEKFKKAIDKGDCLDVRGQINLLERIVSRFFADTSYKQMLDAADKSNEKLINKGEDDFLEEHVKELLFVVIVNMEKELKSFGLPSKNDAKIDKSIHIHNQHSINQSQVVTSDFIKEVLKDSLTGKEYNELIEIAKSEKSPEKAALKIIDKLKDFGSDVASNIIANILTNPHFLSTIF